MDFLGVGNKFALPSVWYLRVRDGSEPSVRSEEAGFKMVASV